jgi:hypothetical protein
MRRHSRVVQVGFGAALLVGSFFTTLWLTAPNYPEKPAAAYHISNDFNLLKATRDFVVLPLSQRMTGNIDTTNRINEHEVSIVGWVADTEGDGTPTEVLVFAGGAFIAATQTKGERSDVTQAQHLGFGLEKNVSFSLNFDCRPGDPFVVVAIAASKHYFPFGSYQCP